MEYLSWGRYPKAKHHATSLYWQSELPKFDHSKTYLPYGLGRSYGDSCLNDGGELLVTSGLNKIMNFNQQSGVIECEAGLSLQDLINFALPQGWFLPVSPGTKYVTIGGAIANDIHGKNHHRAGTFGSFVKSFKLLRSNQTVYHCSANNNADLYKATIAGLGLTGLIVSAQIQLKKVEGPLIQQEVIKFRGLEEFLEISQSSSDFEYTVAWLDCVSSGENFARGHFIRGNHSKTISTNYSPRKLPLTVPFNFPGFALNKYSVQAFNSLYYNRQVPKMKSSEVHYNPFFYPLDGVNNWNRIYGSAGLLQFQCVVPLTDRLEGIKKIMKMVVASGRASFLAVLKEFGNIPSPGMLSFPREGITLCLDFPNSPATRDLLKNLDLQVRELGGASYPAKDAIFPKESFMVYYPKWKEFAEFKDPHFSSDFWKRVTR